MDTQVLIYTCANNGYEDFAPLLTASALWSRSQNFVEFGVPDITAFGSRHRSAIELLREFFADRFEFTEVDFPTGIAPNSIRFLTTPLVEKAYTYIIDADIIFLDRNFPSAHLEHLNQTGLPYSNALRPKEKRRLTGLHFTRSDARYPLPEVTSVSLSMDEHLLAEQVAAKGHAFPNDYFRPVPGIHASPNREIYSAEKPGWGNLAPWIDSYVAFRRSDIGRRLWPLLKGYAAASIAQLDDVLDPSSPSSRTAFLRVFKDNKWQSLESVSGPGSTKSATAELLPQLLDLTVRRSIRTLIDAPCGDFNWIAPVAEHVEYRGFDVVPDIIEIAKGRAKYPFRVLDIVEEVLPSADAILCRDCLVHLPEEMIEKVIHNFVASGSGWLLTTTFPELQTNQRGSLAGWRPINLQLPPFNFPEPEELLIERPSIPPNRKYGQKALALWRLSALGA